MKQISIGTDCSGIEAPIQAMNKIVKSYASFPLGLFITLFDSWTLNFASEICVFTWTLYDSSPADTTPDYCLTLERISSGAHYVKLNSTSAEYLKFFLFEVKQWL